MSLTKGILQMRLFHTRPVTAATFDEPNLVSAAGLAARTPLLAGIGEGLVCVDVDDTVIQVHGDPKQGAGFGYSKVQGLNALLANDHEPVSAGDHRAATAHGRPVPPAARWLAAAVLAVVRSLRPAGAASQILLRANSAFYGHAAIGVTARVGALVSVTIRINPR